MRLIVTKSFNGGSTPRGRRLNARDELAADPAGWCRVAPREALAWFSGLSTPWWIAGGWALDLFLGGFTRPHADLDVGVFRCDAEHALRMLCSWEVYQAKDGKLAHLPPGAKPRADVNSLWCRPSGDTLWSVELMLDESDRASWVYRSDARIRRNVAELLSRDRSGLPYLTPEVQLLYKSNRTRPKDHDDFHRVAPRLAPAARTWLLESLRLTVPSHPWIADLECGGKD
jgi:hypothetical protein